MLEGKKTVKSDYLKFYRVVTKFYRIKYNIQEAELDSLLYLYSERYFTSTQFYQIAGTMFWKKNRWYKLINEGWIIEWRRSVYRNKKTIYALSVKAICLVEGIYRKLEGEEISTAPGTNKIFLKNVPYTHKVYRHMIKTMNEYIHKQRMHSRDMGEAVSLEGIYDD